LSGRGRRSGGGGGRGRDSPIQRGNDFNDQLVALSSIGGISWVALLAWVEKDGGDPKSLKVVEIPFTATVAAATYTNAHHAETAPLMAEFTGLPLATIQHMVRGAAGTTIVPEQLQTVIDASVEYGALKRSFPAQELIDTNVR
jgi:ABC-type nitrate/sulfonate/bicarbonate transport system substrate-binding protein